MKKFSELGVGKPKLTNMRGDRIQIDKVLNREIEVLSFTIEPSKKYERGQLLTIQIKLNDEFRVIFTGSKGLISQISEISKEDFPFKATIIKEDGVYEFS